MPADESRIHQTGGSDRKIEVRNRSGDRLQKRSGDVTGTGKRIHKRKVGKRHER